LASLLPPKKPELEPYPEIVEDAKFVEGDIVDVRARSFPASAGFFDHGCPSQFGGDDDDAWEDDEEDEEDHFAHMNAEPDCRPQ
jgi:DnaJ family protein A protein 2